MRIGSLALLLVAASCSPRVSATAGDPLVPDTTTSGADRSQTIVATIAGADAPLLPARATEVDAKYAKMSASPFAFLRGNIALFDRDFSLASPAALAAFPSAWAVLQEDPHPENLGTLGEDASLVAEWNDFDGSRVGPTAHDVLRGAIAVAVFTGQVTGGADSSAEVHAFLDGYRARDPGAGGRIVSDVVALAQTAGPSRDELSDVKNGSDGPRFKRSGSRIDVDPQTADAIVAALPAYESTRLGAPAIGAARDVVQVVGKGVGSLPMRRYWILIAGPAGDGSEDLILQAKEAWDRSAAASTLEAAQAAVFGARTDGVPAARDPELGWLTLADGAFVVTTVSGWEQGVDGDTVAAGLASGAYDENDLIALARFAGGTLADTHARGGAWTFDLDPDAAAIVAEGWAFWTDRDASIFRELVATGGLSAGPAVAMRGR